MVKRFYRSIGRVGIDARMVYGAGKVAWLGGQAVAYMHDGSPFNDEPSLTLTVDVGLFVVKFEIDLTYTFKP